MVRTGKECISFLLRCYCVLATSTEFSPRSFHASALTMVPRRQHYVVNTFLAHLSLEAHRCAYSVGWPLSSVCMSTFSNIFSSETTGLIEAKFHMQSSWDGRTKVCSNGSGHMIKMAAMSISVKNLKKSSSPEPKGWWPWNLVFSIVYSITTKIVQLMTLGWPWPILRQGQIWSLMLLYGKKVKQWIIQKLL